MNNNENSIQSDKIVTSPKISVIIPTYNGERTIERAIESVLNQEGNHDIEILVCDDWSTDKTCEKAMWLGAKIYLNIEHTGGPNAGRNKGIDIATGELIAFLDQDDEWLPWKLNAQIAEIGNGYELVGSANILKVE